MAILAHRPTRGYVVEEMVDVRVTYLHCPVCRVVMDRVNFAYRSGVLVNVCRPHGSWLGRGELHGVMEFIARGGLTAPGPTFAHFVPE